MKIVSAKCPNCGGILEVDSEKDAAICQFCQTPFIVEKAIENYNITNNYTTVNNTYHKTINNISGQEVHVHQDGESPEQLLENIKALLNRKEYDLAEKTYAKLKEKYPTDYRVDETMVLFVLNGYELGGYGSNKWCRQFAGYENLRLIPMDLFIVVLNKLKKLNKEAYATYYNELLNVVNKRLSRDFDKVLHGKMLLSKVYVDKLLHEGYRGEHHGLDELITKFNMLDKITISSNYNTDDCRRLAEDIDYINKQLSLRAKDMKQNCYTTCINEDNYEYSYQNGSVIEDEGTDDDYLISLISILKNNLSKIQAWMPLCKSKKSGNYYIEYIERAQRQSEQHLIEFCDATISRLSPEGKKKYDEEQEKIKKEQRSNVIKNFWNNYTNLLRANCAKDAYNSLLSNLSIKGVQVELTKFKKGLLGVKYLGDISAFTVDKVINESLKAEGL